MGMSLLGVGYAGGGGSQAVAPFAWYRNNGTDWSGNGNNLAGTVGTTTGFNAVPNAAIAFVGSDIYARASPLVTALPLSFAGWFNLPLSGDSVVLFQQYASGVGHPTSNQSLTDDGDMLTALAGLDFLNGPSLQGAGWIHVAFVVTNPTWYLYISGTLVAQLDGTAVFTAEDTFELGSLATFAAQYFGVWDVALTQGQVNWLAAGHDPTV